jgi:hypothetical protein
LTSTTEHRRTPPKASNPSTAAAAAAFTKLSDAVESVPSVIKAWARASRVRLRKERFLGVIAWRLLLGASTFAFIGALIFCVLASAAHAILPPEHTVLRTLVSGMIGLNVAIMVLATSGALVGLLPKARDLAAMCLLALYAVGCAVASGFSIGYYAYVIVVYSRADVRMTSAHKYAWQAFGGGGAGGKIAPAIVCGLSDPLLTVCPHCPSRWGCCLIMTPTHSLLSNWQRRGRGVG